MTSVRPPQTRTLVALALALGGLLATAVQAAAGPSTVSSRHPQPPPSPVRAETVGASAPSGQLTATLALAPADRRGLQQLATQRPLAGATATARRQRADAIARTAPTSATRQRLTRQLRAAGLTITDRTWALDATGSPAALERVFAVRLTRTGGHRVVQGAPRLPAGVTAVTGLDDVPVVHRLAAYTPAQLRSAYAVDRPQSTGAGTTVATVQFSGWDAGSLSTFASQQGLTLAAGQLTQIGVDGANPATPDGGDGDVEVALDQETILGAAPAAQQRAYFGPNTGQGIVDTYNAIANDAASTGIVAASSSWGACEPANGANLRAAVQDAITRALAAGTTFFASSGDSGAFDCSSSAQPDNRLAVDFPASLPQVVAVGGTALPDASGSATETAWSQPSGQTGSTQYRGPGGGGGGGGSAVYARPSYQSAVGIPGTTRLVPDVAADADPRTGAYVYLARTGGLQIGGTSLSSPLWAGHLASALASLGCSTGLGDIHPTLYASGSAFHDVTSGNNLNYSAGSGYDEATGLGTPVWRTLAKTLEPTAGCPGGTFTPLTPARILDTRIGNGAPRSPIGQGGVLQVPVLGRDGVPSSGVSAVVVNVTAVAGPTESFFTVFPTGAAVPNASNLNFVGGQVRANLVEVGVGSGGSISIYNDRGSNDAVADVVGYYASSSATNVGARYFPLTPRRLLDTRNGTGAPAGRLGPGGVLALTVGGQGGVSSGASAVALNVTAVTPSQLTFIQAYPDGVTRPNSSNLNPPAGSVVPNLVVSPVGSNGKVDLYNEAGTVDLVADVVGYYASAGTSGTRFMPITPTRLLDTRIGTGAPQARVAARQVLPLTVAGNGPVPATAASVVVNVTGVVPSTATFVTVYPGDTSTPTASSLNLFVGDITPNLVAARIGSIGSVNLYTKRATSTSSVT